MNVADLKMEKYEEFCFYQMMADPVLDIVNPYLKQEQYIIDQTIKEVNNSFSCFVGVGSGPLLHNEIILRHKMHYIAVDPLIHKYVNVEKHNIGITCYSQKISEIELERSASSYMFGFLFNVASYINLGDIYSIVSKYAQKGDVLFVFTWAKTVEAEALRKKYIELIRLSMNIEVGSSPIKNSFNIYNIQPEKLSNYSSHRYLTQKYCESLVIYL